MAAIAGKVMGRSGFIGYYGYTGERIGYHGVKAKDAPKNP